MVLGFGVPFLGQGFGFGEFLALGGEFGGIAREGGLILAFAGESARPLLRLRLLLRREDLVIFLEHLRF